MSGRRTIHIQSAVAAELERHGTAIDADISISKIHLTVAISRETGLPEHITYSAVTHSPLTKKPGAVKIRTFTRS